jgi:hypothetical protein
VNARAFFLCGVLHYLSDLHNHKNTPKTQNPKSVMSKLIVSELIDKFKLSTHV